MEIVDAIWNLSHDKQKGPTLIIKTPSNLSGLVFPGGKDWVWLFLSRIEMRWSWTWLTQIQGMEFSNFYTLCWLLLVYTAFQLDTRPFHPELAPQSI